MDSDISMCVDNEVNITSASEETANAADNITDNVEKENVDDNEIVADTEIKKESEEPTNKEPGEHFIVSSMEEMTDILDDYFDRTNSHFIIQKKSKYFGVSASDCDLSGHQVQWMDMQKKHGHYTDIIVQFDGVPHICVGNMYLNCQFGYDSSLAKKIKRKEMREKGELDNIKCRNLKTPSKKCGCPATIVLRQIIKFPEFKIEKDTEWRRRDGAGRLKAKIRDDRENLVTEVAIIGRLPHISEHKFHEILEGHLFAKEMIHRDIIIKVQELYLENKSHNEIKEAIHQYAINEKFSKDDTIDFNRRRFFPQMKDIHNIVLRFRPLCRFTTDDENDLKSLIEAIKSLDGKINLDFQINDHDPKTNRGNVKNESSSEEDVGADKESTKLRKKKEKVIQTFLFTFQTPKQQRLMRKYCQVAYIIEVQQKPIRRCISYRLYLLIAQTNLDFQVIGCIVVSKPRNDGLIEGLKLVKEWNPSWNPKYFLVDCSQVIYDAVSSVFPDSNYFLNPLSCENKWQDVTSSPTNDLMEHSEEVLTYLKNMQYALTEDALNIAAAYLEASEIWQSSEKLRTWFLTSWLPVAKMWVYGYRPEDLLITHHVKTSLDNCIQPYQDALSFSAKINGLIEFLKKISLDISENEYDRYEKSNNEQYLFFQKFFKSNFFSESMQGIPVSLIPYTEGICKLAESTDFTITCGNLGVFSIQANVEKELEESSDLIQIAETDYGSIEYPRQLDSREFTVSFGDSNSYPFCTCSQWLYYRIPCVHMFAIICNVPGWKFDMLSPLYRLNPVFGIDTSCVHYPINCSFDEKSTQVEKKTFESNETQTEDSSKMFTFPFHNAGLGVLNEQKKKTQKALDHLKGISYLFKSQLFYEDICKQMGELLNEIEKEIELAQKDMSMIKDWLSIDNPDMEKEQQSYIKTSLITTGERDGEMIVTPILAPVGKDNNLECLQQAITRVDRNSTIIKINNTTDNKSPILNRPKKVVIQSGVCKNPVKSKIVPLEPLCKKRKLPTVNITNYKNIFKCDGEISQSSPSTTKTPLCLTKRNEQTNDVKVKKEKPTKNTIPPKKDDNDKNDKLENSDLSVLSILPRMNKSNISEKSEIVNAHELSSSSVLNNESLKTDIILKESSDENKIKEVDTSLVMEITCNNEPSNEIEISKSLSNLTSEVDSYSNKLKTNAPNEPLTQHIIDIATKSTINEIIVNGADEYGKDEATTTSFALEPAKNNVKNESLLADETVKKIESIIHKLELDAQAMKSLSCDEVISVDHDLQNENEKSHMVTKTLGTEKDAIEFLVCNEHMESIENSTTYPDKNLTEIKNDKFKLYINKFRKPSSLGLHKVKSEACTNKSLVSSKVDLAINKVEQDS